MNNTVNNPKSGALQALYKKNETAKALMDWLASRQYGARTTTARRAAQVTGQDYRAMVKVMKELGGMEFGRFLTGRKGQKTRIEWAFDVRSLGKVASGGGTRLEEVAADAEFEEDGPVEPQAKKNGAIPHIFQLRPNVKVEIALPEDLSEREADRLATWIKSLPFG